MEKFAGAAGLWWGEEGGREQPGREELCAKGSAGFPRPGLPTSNICCAEVMP